MLFFLRMMQPHVQVFSRLKSDLTRKESKKTASKTFVVLSLFCFKGMDFKVTRSWFKSLGSAT